MDMKYEVNDDFVSVNDVVKDILSEIEQNQKKFMGVTGISTGFDTFDSLTNGLHPGEFIVLGGRPSMGKTAFVLNIAKRVGSNPGNMVAYFSLEMSDRQLTNRIMSSEAQINFADISRIGLSNDEWMNVISAADKVAKLNILIDDTPAISVSDIYNKCCSLQKKYGLSMVIIDYLQLITCNDKKETRKEEVAEVSRVLKALSREINVPVIALSQLSRAVDQREDHHPLLSDLRESDATEQEADMIIFLYRDKYYNKDSSVGNIAEIIVSKHRNGKCGMVELLWDPKSANFYDKDSKYLNNPCTGKEIVRAVCKKYGVLEEDIISKKRNSEIVLPRQIVMYLCRELTDMSIEEIGRLLGKKDHTTVMSGISKIKSMIKCDEQLEKAICSIETEIKK